MLRGDLIESFARTNEADFAYSPRASAASASTSSASAAAPAWSIVACPSARSPLDDLGLPQVIGRFARAPRPRLLTGPTGSGKTTTLAGMVDNINQHRDVHIVTIEDPIEILHRQARMVNQREVHVDTADFKPSAACRDAVGPDVIPRRRDARPGDGEGGAPRPRPATSSCRPCTPPTPARRSRASSTSSRRTSSSRSGCRWSPTLRGIICQRLVPRADNPVAAAAMEICINTGRVAEAIVEPEKTPLIPSLVSEGGFYGMQTFDQHLMELFRDGVITLDAAMDASTSPHDLMVELRRLGLVA